MKLRRALEKALFALFVTAIIGYALFPFYWAIVTSLRSGTDIFLVDLIPKRPTLDNYRNVLTESGFLRSLWNSVLVSGVTVLASLAIAILSSWSLGRVSFKGRTTLLLTILSVSMFPQIAVLSGMFELIRWLGLYNNPMGLALCYMVLVLPFTVWVMTSFMRSLPREIEEAAIMDGCGPIKIVLRVFLPLMKPAIATTGLLAFIAAWNEFLFALTFTLSADNRTVPVAIAMLSGASQYDLPWGNIMAASVLVTLPLVALVLLFQRQIVSGLTSGAVKG